jgi:hypothetical protein
MDYIEINRGIITYRGSEYQYESYERVDDMCVHVFMSGGVYAFIGNECTINNVLCINSDEIIQIILQNT